MTNSNLEQHFGHDIVVARYHNLDNQPITYNIECETCFEVLLEEGLPDEYL